MPTGGRERHAGTTVRLSRLPRQVQTLDKVLYLDPGYRSRRASRRLTWSLVLSLNLASLSIR